jgi:hypothetical protein
MQELLKALVRARKNFKTITKNREGYGYKYADLGELFDATLPALAAEGILVIQVPVCPTPQLMGIRTELWHESGQSLAYEFVPDLNLQNVGTQKGVQALGSLISYLKRYHFAAILNLAAEDDDGAAAVQEFKAAPKGQAVKAFKATEADDEKKQKLLSGIRELINKRWPDKAKMALKMAELEIDLTEVKNYDTAQLTKVLEALTNAK